MVPFFFVFFLDGDFSKQEFGGGGGGGGLGGRLRERDKTI